MISVCFYFQVHQPFRLRKDYSFFSIGRNHDYEDENLNSSLIRKVAEKCYLPANKLMLKLIKKYDGDFRIAFSISGLALEQFEMYAPEVLDSFCELVNTGCVELLGETYYHSIAYLRSEIEFKEQIRVHENKLKSIFGITPSVFCNTELIYDNKIADLLKDMNYSAILTEGTEKILGWRSPNFLYQPTSVYKMKLLLKNYRLSDDLAFRFSEKKWPEYPLTPEKYASWIHRIAGNGEVVNLFMDYETFGEHQWESSGIFNFLEKLPEAIMEKAGFFFNTPSEVAALYQPVAKIDVPSTISWADSERDLSAWIGNPLQDSSIESVYSMEDEIQKSGDKELIHLWRKLLSSDHFYYMCTKSFNDGNVHNYFSPFNRPEDAYIVYNNIINDFKGELKKRKSNMKYKLRGTK